MSISDWSSDVCSSDLNPQKPMSNVDRCGLLAEQCSRPLGRETAFWAAARLWPAPRGTRDRKDYEREGRSMRTDLRRLTGAGMGAGVALAGGLGPAGGGPVAGASKDPDRKSTV